MVLKPCTDHRTLSGAPKERRLSALCVPFPYDRRDTSGSGSARAQGHPGTKNDCGTRSPLPTESLVPGLMHTCCVSNTKDSHSPRTCRPRPPSGEMAALQDTTRGEARFQRVASGLALRALTRGHPTHP